MNRDSKLVKMGITWLPPLFALNMFTCLTILSDCWLCLRGGGGGGGSTHIKVTGMLDGKLITSEPLRETNVGVAEA